MLDAMARLAEQFIGVFENGAEVFVGLVTGIIPLLIILLTAVNALIRFVGEDRMNKVGEWAGRPGWIYTPIRFLIWPIITVFFLTNPACYTGGVFLPERNKAAFYDSAVSFVHPITGLFPHANAAELFVWLGIANGIEDLGLPISQLAIRYLLVGMVVIFLRGIVTQFIYDVLARRSEHAAGDEALVAEGA
jgi:PTS system glucitol/sorbitol-specific IIC component